MKAEPADPHAGMTMDKEGIPLLAEPFLETRKAHHKAFVSTGGFDPGWPLW